MFCYADNGQVGDSARGGEIRRLLHVISLCRAHSQGIIHRDGMSSDRDRYLLSERWRYDSYKEQGEAREAGFHTFFKVRWHLSDCALQKKNVKQSCGD